MSKQAKPFVRTALFVALTLAWLIPILWMFNTAIKPNEHIFTRPPQWIPPSITLQHFRDIFANWPFGMWLLNSFIVAAGATLLSLLLSIPAAYSFSRMRWRGRNVLFFTMIASMLIPWQINAIPLYFMMNEFGLLNTRIAIVLPIAAMPVGIFLLRQFFINIPRELEEAAKIDGCSTLGILVRIILPISLPALAALGIYMFVFTWNEFFWSIIALNKQEMFTIPIGLKALQGAYDIEYGLLMAGAALASLPVLIVYLILQRRIITGITMSSAEIK